VPKEESTTKVLPRPTLLPQRSSESMVDTENSDLNERVVRSELVKSIGEVQPQEKVVVEMTPEEQDVYALMGISPLIKLNREIKNFRSVAVSVVLPGEAEQTESYNNLSEDSNYSGETPSFFQVPKEKETPEKVLVKSPAEESSTEDQTDNASELESGPSLVRRRRRRSSAVDS